MYRTSLGLLALTVGLFSASQAKASTIDTFQLTGNGSNYLFSLTASSAPSTSCPVTGDFCYKGIIVNGNQTDTIEFTSSGELEIFDHNGHSIIDLSLKNNQSLYFTETAHPGTVTFKVGTFNLKVDGNGNDRDEECDDCNRDPNYTLTITDPPAPVPEPSSLALISSGMLAAAGAVRRRMK